MGHSIFRRFLFLFLTITVALPTLAFGSGTEFRHWGVGWDGLPALRYRSEGGWIFTLRGKIQPNDDENYYYDEDYWYSDEVNARLTKSESITREFAFDASRQFDLGKGISLGPLLFAKHYYNHFESEYERLSVRPEDEFYSYSVEKRNNRGEAWQLGGGMRPVWQVHSRISVEFKALVYYQKNKSRREREEHREESDGDSDDFSNLEETETSNWYFSPSSVSSTMSLALFFYF